MTQMDLPLQQSPGFARALSLLGRDIETRALETGIQAFVIKRKLPIVGSVTLVSRGPVWPQGTEPESRLTDLMALGATVINAEAPDTGVLRAAGYRQIMTPAHIAQLDIRGSAAERRARLAPKWRASLRKTPLRMTLRAFDLTRDSWLFDADSQTQKSRKFRSLPHDISAKFAITSPDDVLFAQMHGADGPIAAMLFLRHGRVATYHIGWTTLAGRKAAAHHHLLMQAADRLARQGVASIDLGQVNTEDLPGLARFKIGTGAQVRALGGTWLRLPGCRRRLA